MRTRARIVVTVMVLTGILCGTTWAGETGHYPLGSEGIKAATLPPPGLYLKTYNTFYTANVGRDSGGDNDGTGLDLDVLALVPRLIWMTDIKILGADYGMDFLVPFQTIDVELDTFGLKWNESCLGDMFIEPVDLAWHGERYDIGAAFGLWMPTGKYNKTNPASPGKDFWTSMFTLGGTYYLNEEKSLSASVLSRYEIHSEKDHTEVRPGHDVVIEWGVGQSFAQVWEAGVVGYAQWQVTDDNGDDVVWDKSVHDRVAAIGPEVSVFIPEVKASVGIRALWEFSAVDRPEGTTVTLTIIKIF